MNTNEIVLEFYFKAKDETILLPLFTPSLFSTPLLPLSFSFFPFINSFPTSFLPLILCVFPSQSSSLLLCRLLSVSHPLSSLAEIMRMYQGAAWWRTDRWSLLQQAETGEKEGGEEKWEKERDEDKNLQIVEEQRKMEQRDSAF